MQPSRQIAMKQPRTFEDFRLSECSPARIREVAVVGTAYDSILASDFTYVSTPITSGAALYRAMDDAGVGTPEALREDAGLFRRTVIEPNFQAADAVAQRMLAFGGAVIAPAAFEARTLGWEQDAYMGLWLDTIERKATRLALVDGWEYSNGGAEEYLQALLMQSGRRDRNDIEIVDARGVPLPHHKALMLLAGAVDDLTARGFIPVQLARVLCRTATLHGMVDAEGRYGQLADFCGKTVFSVGKAYNDTVEPDELHRAIRDTRSLREAVTEMLPASERQLVSSLDMAPGLVRTEDRKDLQMSRASLLQAAKDEPE